jgi:hypothetical protein
MKDRRTKRKTRSGLTPAEAPPSQPRRLQSGEQAIATTPPRMAEPASAEPPPPSTRTGPTSPARRLDSILRALPPREIDALVERMGIRIDDKKRIDGPAQVARALVRLPDVREPSRLPPPSAELLRRIAESNGSLLVVTLPAGLEVLVRRGIVYARLTDQGIELVLPTAFLVQMKSWEGEDPHSLRALLADAPFETASAVASHYLGRPATPPIALSLEPAWEVLGDAAALRSEIERIAHQERRLLDQIEQVGGEVDSSELMDLEREPMRVRGAYGVAAGRRGAAFSLEKRGFLFPLHPNRYVIPTEVAAVIGDERRRQREERREQIRSHVIAEDHLPRRARFSTDPAPVAVGLTLGLREGGAEVRAGVGTPRSIVTRLAQRFGRDVEATSLLGALCRAVGLWESSGVSAASPPGSLRLWQLSALLFDTWRRGGAWDEARSDSELLRVAPEHRDPSPVGVLREMVLDALQDLGEGQWVPYEALTAYVADDPRAAGLERLFVRWARRVGLSTPEPMEIARRILLESLPALGVVDVGGADTAQAGRAGEPKNVALRLTSRGRELIAGEQSSQRAAHNAELVQSRRLRVGMGARVADVLDLWPFVELVAADGALELEVSAAAVARGLAEGIQASEMRARLEALAPLSHELGDALEEAGTVIGRGELVAAAGFVWIEDREIRALLLSSQGAADLFVDPSPPGGLLVAPGVDPERLTRRCRALGVDIRLDETVARVSRSTVPPPKNGDPKKALSWRPPSTRSSRKTEEE